MLRNLMCRFGWCGMVTRSDDTHIWGECLRCGKRAGLISREAVRRYAEAEARHREYLEHQAATLAAKPNES